MARKWGEPNLLLTGMILQLRGPLKVTFSKKRSAEVIIDKLADACLYTMKRCYVVYLC